MYKRPVTRKISTREVIDNQSDIIDIVLCYLKAKRVNYELSHGKSILNFFLSFCAYIDDSSLNLL